MTESQAQVLESAAAGKAPLREAERRRPTFKPGVSIVLCNGEAWAFPEPRMRYDPFVDEEGKFRLRKTRAVISPEIDPYLDEMMTAETDAEILESTLGMAAAALRINYQLEADELPQLIHYVTDDEANFAIWHQLIEFARGRILEPPKPSRAG